MNYTVQDTRVGNVTDYDRLILEVWTDGSLRPEEAVSKAAGILVMHLKLFQNMDGLPEEEEEEEATFPEEEEDDSSKVRRPRPLRTFLQLSQARQYQHGR